MMEIHTKDSLLNEFQSSLKNIKVVKRDGRHVSFDDQKIYDALIKAETKIKGSIDPINRRTRRC